MKTVAELRELDNRTQDLVKHAAVGHEVLILDSNNPVARIVSIQPEERDKPNAERLKYQSFHLEATGPSPSRSEIAEEMFNRE